MAEWSTILHGFAYFSLLFFIVPIRYNKVPAHIEEQFLKYINDFNKSYENDTDYQLRLEAFQNSLDTIAFLNSNETNESAQYGLTKFSDMLPDEFYKNQLLPVLAERVMSHRISHSSEVTSKESHEEQNSIHRAKRAFKDIPKKVDWREKRVVTKVRDQYDCGACWAFSAIETVESMYAIKHGKLYELSVQEMIDCAGNNNQGCEGGDICSLLEWMQLKKVPVQNETDYPLHFKTGRCQKNTSAKGVTVDKIACDRFVGKEDIVLYLLANNGPVAVAINAKTWQNYVGGTIQYHCDGDVSQLNHAVQIVGYDLTAKIPHYIVRNTWGEDFGDNGYLYIAIGKNTCGIANEVSALTVL